MTKKNENVSNTKIFPRVKFPSMIFFPGNDIKVNLSFFFCYFNQMMAKGKKNDFPESVPFLGKSTGKKESLVEHGPEIYKKN